MAIAVDFSALKGRLMQVDRDGVRVGRVVAVDGGPRKGLRAIRLASPRYEGSDRWSWRGPEYCVRGRDLAGRCTGVLFRRRLIPIDDFLRMQKVVGKTHGCAVGPCTAKGAS